MRFWLLAIFCSILPDLDIFAFYWGIHYGSVLGHRGFTHSLFFAFLLTAGVMLLGFRELRLFSSRWWKMGAFFLSLNCSHGILDAMTDGGLGVAFFSPFIQTRYYLPWTPLKVSPLGLDFFFSSWGREVLVSEITWVWVPAILLGVAVRGLQKLNSRRMPREVKGVRPLPPQLDH